VGVGDNRIGTFGCSRPAPATGKKGSLNFSRGKVERPLFAFPTGRDFPGKSLGLWCPLKTRDDRDHDRSDQ
jgi:hypothetical protein